ncbi:Hsp20/alpha crystallin family protein [Paenibacillus flagellatus]|uniref:Heat-shock protein Hsp20 n=1 Tax=Paenibacillus flagellatus TaxID=2211139 RepID=A0A2V5KV93_9BACL|nr:Hsp20/alpha crystallin family protein [Paenibacillus flagellatus]PYI53406.1 heat-shock protein Hsp20 [Paenibacillus flagellatus]
MPLIPYESFRNLDGFKRDLDRLFNDFPAFVRGEQQFGAHRIDVYETDTEVVATCDLPGLEKKEDVDIDVRGNVLTVSGTLTRTHEVQEERMHRQERFYGRFQRSVELPAAVDDDNVKASYRNGVLEIRMAKLQPPPRKKIDIDFH